MESTHHDHLLILSYKTLSTLMSRADFSTWQTLPYFSQFSEMKLRRGRAGRIALAIGEAGVNFVEFLCPLLSFGWIIDARLGLRRGSA
jgi:hypothetical protein